MNTTKENIELDCCTISWLEDGIILMDIHNGAVIDDITANQMIDKIIKFSGNQPFSIITDTLNKLGNFTTEGRKIFATHKEYNKLRVKSAILVNNLPVRLLVNFYIKVDLKGNSTRLFSTQKEALAWIKA
jgi:hypothetical protein